MDLLPLLSTLFIILGTIFYYFLYFKPQKIIKKYSRAFTQRGYKVFVYPYKLFDFPLLSTFFKDNTTGDAFKTVKNEWVKYDIIIANQFHNPSIAFLSPNAIKQFVKHENEYKYIKFPKIMELQARLIGRGLVFSEGQSWKRKRRILSSLFTHQFVIDNIPEIQKICQDALNQLQIDSQNLSSTQLEPNTFRYDLLQLTGKMFSDVILTLFLGIQSTKQKLQGDRVGHFMIQLANQSNHQMNKILPMIFGPKFLNLGLTADDRRVNNRMRILDEWAENYCNRVIKRGNQRGKQKNILELLKQKNISDSSEQNFTKKQLVEEFKTFFLAGADTTSHLLQMMIYYIGKNPSVEKKARQQIGEKLKDGKCTYENLKNLKYLDAIQKQTTRIYGPVNFNFPRVVAKDHHFDGVLIQKGTLVLYNSVCTHYNPMYYKDPFTFNPERWMNQNQISKDSTLLNGFGVGSRSCLGQILAKIEAKIGLVKFLTRYPKFKVPQKDVELKWKFLYVPDDFSVEVVKQSKPN